MDCYVYYRVVSTHEAAAAQAVASLFALATLRFGVSARLQQRADEQSDKRGGAAPLATTTATTWMERYDGATPAFVAALPDMATQCGLPALIDGERHVECFVDRPSPCA